MCQRGSPTCPGNVSLDTARQCKSHRILARVKAKMDAASGDGEGAQQSWIRAAKADNDFSPHPRQGKCRKECCRLVHPQQVCSKLHFLKQ